MAIHVKCQATPLLFILTQERGAITRTKWQFLFIVLLRFFRTSSVFIYIYIYIKRNNLRFHRMILSQSLYKWLMINRRSLAGFLNESDIHYEKESKA